MTRRRLRDLNPAKEAEFDAILAALPPGMSAGWPMPDGTSRIVTSGAEDPAQDTPAPDVSNRCSVAFAAGGAAGDVAPSGLSPIDPGRVRN